MSPKQHKKIWTRKQKQKRQWTQGSYVFGRQLVQNQVSLPCKMLQFLGDFTWQTQFICINFNRASLNIFCQKWTFFAGSGSAQKVMLPFPALKCKMSQFLGDFTWQTQFIYINFNRALLNIFCNKQTFLAGSGSA